MAEKNEKEKAVNEQIRDFGQVELEHGGRQDLHVDDHRRD